jgi:parallel beta-helix repeat protein
MRRAWILPVVLLSTALRCKDAPGPALSGPASYPPESTPTLREPVTSEGCPGDGFVRLVRVRNQVGLLQAIEAAVPGDQIRLAPGTYLNGFHIDSTRDGTSDKPITLCGPREAVIDNNGFENYVGLDADWWVFRGFTVRGGLWGIYAQDARHNIIDGLLIEGTGQEGITLHGTSSNNLITRTTIRETGLTVPRYGEGIYIGDGKSGDDPADDNQIIGNFLGPNIRSEHVDVKAGTSGNLVQGNHSDATGYQWLAQFTTGVYVTYGGNDTRFIDNSIVNLSSPHTAAFQSWRGNANEFHGNSVSGTFTWGFSLAGGSSNVIGCDNQVHGGPFSNVACR